MDLLSFLAVAGLTLFIVLLCCLGMYANRRRVDRESSQKRPKLIIEQKYRVRSNS